MQWTTEKHKLSELIPTYYNPRKLSDKAKKDLKESLTKFNLVEIPVVNKDLTLLAGHQRCIVLADIYGKDLEVDVRIPDKQLSKKDADEYLIRSNKNIGDWDWDKLVEDFEHEDLTDWGFEDWEFPEEEEEDPDFDESDDDIPESAPAITQSGDLYQLDEHRLLCGDATMINEIEKLMDGKLADLYLTDPPYNVDYEGKTKDALKIDNDKQDDTEFLEFLDGVFTNASCHLKEGGAYYIWHADSEGYNFRKAATIIGKVRQCLIWLKDTMVMGRQDYHWQHEPCLYGWKDGAAHFWNTDRKQTTILEFDRPKRNEAHPTMKPIQLFAYLLRNNTKRDQIVLDTFLGSGTTLIACEKTKRKCYGMELDPKYCDVIVQRYVDYCKQNKLKPVVTRNGEQCLDFNGR